MHLAVRSASRGFPLFTSSRFPFPVSRSLGAPYPRSAIGRIIEAKLRLRVVLALAGVAAVRTASEGHQFLAEDDQRPSRHGARQRLWNAHHADVGIDGAIEREIFGKR